MLGDVLTTDAAPPSITRPPRLVRLLALAVGAGAASGLLTSLGQTVLPGPFGGLANAVSPWLVVPFVVGASARRWPWAVLVGVLACAAQVGGYYGTSVLRGFGVGSSWTVFWLVCAVPGGVLAGAAGWSWWRAGEGTARARRRWVPSARGLGGALLVAAWLAEGVVTYGVVLHYAGHAVLFVTVACLALVLLGRHGRQHAAIVRWLGPAAVLAGAGFAVLHTL